MIDYDPHNWRSHLLDIRGSMLREILSRVLLCVAWAITISAVDAYLLSIQIPPTIHLLLGTATGLLLVFRTNTSYDRFWEGRRMWGGIINESRNLARMSCALLHDVPQLRDVALRWTIGFAHAARQHLRGARSLGDAAVSLPKEEVDAALATHNVPLVAAKKITDQFVAARRAGVISDQLLVALDQNVQLLIDYLGACERIHKTPLPFAYTVHLRRALILYCFTLPLALVDAFGWWTPLCTLLVAYVFFGIEEIGVEIEDPFDDDANSLPLERFCETIQRDLNELIGVSPATKREEV